MDTLDDNIIKSWLQLSNRDSKDHRIDGAITEAEYEAWEFLTDLTQFDPPLAWSYISTITAQLKENHALAYLAAGPMENLLLKLGADYEYLTSVNSLGSLEKLLPYVWTSSLEKGCKEWVEKTRDFKG